MNPPPIATIQISIPREDIVKELGEYCSSPVLIDIATVESNDSREIQSSWLSMQEQKQLNRYTFAKRRREWLAGRICAKIAIRDYVKNRKRILLDPIDLSIVNTDGGHPVAVFAGSATPLKMPEISISHSGEFALALAAESSCGVDIQKANQSIFRVKERFCQEPEEELLLPCTKDFDPLLRLTLLWAAKEAAQKAQSGDNMPGFLDLVLTAIEPAGLRGMVFFFNRCQRHSHLISQTRVLVTDLKQYGIGICIPGKGEHHA